MNALYYLLIGACLPTSVLSSVREWENADGKKVVASFISQKDGKVTLKLKNKKVVSFKAEILSKADQKWLAQERKHNPKGIVFEVDKRKLAGITDIGLTVPEGIPLFKPNPAALVSLPGHSHLVKYINPKGVNPYKGIGDIVGSDNGYTFLFVTAKPGAGKQIYGPDLQPLMGSLAPLKFPKEVARGQSIKGFHDGVSWCKDVTTGKDAIIDLKGRVVTVGKAKKLMPFAGGLAAVEGLDGVDGWQFVNKSGKVVSPRAYYSVQSFSNGRSWVREDSKGSFQLIDQDFKVLAKGFKKVKPFVGDYTTADDSVLKVDGSVHISAVGGRRIIHGDSDCGVAFVRFLGSKSEQNHYRLIHMETKQVYGPKFTESPSNFKYGFSVLKGRTHLMLLNQRGEEVATPFKKPYFRRLGNGLTLITGPHVKSGPDVVIDPTEKIIFTNK